MTPERRTGGLIGAALLLGACSGQPLLNPPANSTGASAGSASPTGGTSSVGGGSTTSGNSTSGPSTSNGSGSTGGSTTSASCGPASLGFGGSWDTGSAQLDLNQDGGSVFGSYREWGYTTQDPAHGGAVSGTVCENQLTGSMQANAAAAPVSLALTLSSQGASSTLQGTWGPDPICGVPSGAGVSLPAGCSWTNGKLNALSGGLPCSVQLTQTGDEVDGEQDDLIGNPINHLHGVVSDQRINGEYVPFPNRGSPGRISFAMTPDWSQFTGNSIHNNALTPWCGSRTSALPSSCLGGGGGYDGTWFTNLGTVTLAQPVVDIDTVSTTVTGVWFLWGSDREYAVTGSVAQGLSWTDDSPVGGAVSLIRESDDPNGLTLTGFTAAGGLWCGVDYTDGLPEPYGTLPPGCGLSGTWTFFQGPSPGPITLTQTRGAVAGNAAGFVVSGTVAANPGGGPTAPVAVSGNWSGAGDGTFNWFPNLSDQAFTGDTNSGTAWCGSLSGTAPSPCYQ